MKQFYIPILIFLLFSSQLLVGQASTKGDVNDVPCPKMQVAMACPLLKMSSSDNYYTIFYCNNGNLATSSAYVEFDLDPYLTIINSGVPVQSQKGNTYTFDLGNVDAFTCGAFKIQVTINNNATVNQLHCAEARIYPTTICQGNNNANQTTTTQNNNTLGRTEGVDHSQATSTNSIFEDNVMLNSVPVGIDSLGVIAGNMAIDIDIVIANIEEKQVGGSMANLITNNQSNYLVVQACRYNIGYYTAGQSQVTSVDNTTNDNTTIKVYPNPMTTSTRFEVTGEEYASLTLKVSDISGRLIKTISVDNQSYIRLTKQDLQAGVYFYQLQANDKRLKTGKLIVQ